MNTKQPIVSITVKSGKELLVEELKATIASKKKRGWSQYKTLEAVRKENEAWAKNGVGLPDEELTSLVNVGYTTARSSRLDCANDIKMQPPERYWQVSGMVRKRRECSSQSR